MVCSDPQVQLPDVAGTHKVHPNSGDVALSVSVVGETQEQAGLAHTRIPDQLRQRRVGNQTPSARNRRKGAVDPLRILK